MPTNDTFANLRKVNRAIALATLVTLFIPGASYAQTPDRPPANADSPVPDVVTLLCDVLRIQLHPGTQFNYHIPTLTPLREGGKEVFVLEPGVTPNLAVSSTKYSWSNHWQESVDSGYPKYHRAYDVYYAVDRYSGRFSVVWNMIETVTDEPSAEPIQSRVMAHADGTCEPAPSKPRM